MHYIVLVDNLCMISSDLVLIQAICNISSYQQTKKANIWNIKDTQNVVWLFYMDPFIAKKNQFEVREQQVCFW